MRVLFVCLGNICRSPAAEGIVQALAPTWHCDSAGTASYHIGHAPYGPMQSAAAGRGVNLHHLRARQFTGTDFADFDLIVAMDAQNRADIEALRPAGNATPVRMMDADDVPDPYYTRDFDGCLDIIQAAAKRLISDTTVPPSG